jgi:hypothetical protein
MAKTPASDSVRFQLRLHDVDPTQPPPKVAVQLVDRAGGVLHTAAAGADGGVELPQALLSEAHAVRIGPAEGATGGAAEELRFVSYRRARFQDLAQAGVVDISRRDWARWVRVVACVDGSVRHCFPFPWVLQAFERQAAPIALEAARLGDVAVAAQAGLEVSPLRPLHPYWRCHLICDGVVEVYRRTCCHYPWLIDDPRLDDLLRELEAELRWPPRPWPEPDPPFGGRLFKEGALDPRALNLARDVASLRSLDRLDRAAFVEARPYLWSHISCGAAAKVAEGFIQDGGDFHICWREWGRFRPVNCYDQYAFKVRQVINGVWVTIYNGVAAGEWFNDGVEANLTSYHWAAIACRDRSGGPGCYLEEIGTTGAHLLNTPIQNGETSVTGPLSDALDWGLAFPGPASPDHNRNWGGDLGLFFHFGEEMKVAEVTAGVDGVVYYRVSVRRADGAGAATGDPIVFDEGLSWKYDDGAGNLLIENLGPATVGGQTNLYRIPYDGDRDWVDPHQSFHAWLHTADATRFTDGRYLVTLEVFNGAGQRLRPAGAGGAGLATAFTYRRRVAETGIGATVPVNQPALTNLFWWDNRPAVGQICALRVGPLASSDECQFLCGTAASEFGVNYRAYHPLAKFQAGHSLVVTRGLSGSTVAELADAPSVDGNVGLGGACGESGSARFDCLLRALPSPAVPPCTIAYPKCSFTANLHVTTKTWNGSGHLWDRDVHRQASFALDTTCP